jgi:glycosyltransferase involved in cell wall biosynthesis
MSNRVKIELIASLLRSGSHDVEIISQGEVVDTSWTFYPAFVEEERFHPDIPIFYGSVLPVRRVNGFWSNAQTLRVLKERHRAQPYDLVIIFNLKGPQLACANYAIQRLHLPVILEYEDDRFVNVKGKTDTDMGGLAMRFEMRTSARLLKEVSGCVAVSPHLMSQLPAGIPTLLLRGVAGDDIVTASRQSRDGKKNIVLFSGTHIESNGVAPLIQAWPQVGMPGWELHITGYGQLTDSLRAMASGMEGVFFHGLVSREQLVSLMSAARVCVNPHQVSQTPGNVFAFKIIEYLAAGAHVVTTPMGALEKPLEAGITYMPANSPETIAATLRTVIREERYQHTASKAAHETYGPTAVSNALNTLLGQVGARR